MRHNVTMGVGDKIKLARKQRGLTQGELATALGLKSQSVVSDLESGKLESWPKHAPKLAKALDKPRSWFEEGLEDSDQPLTMDAAGDLPEMVTVPEYDVRLSAGGGFLVDQETTRREWPLPRFLVVEHLGLSPAPGTLTIQEIVGDSMEPTLHSGDYVLIDLTDQRLGLPGIFAVWDGDALVCKRLERIPGSDPVEVRIKSDNPLHGEYRVPAEVVRVIGRVRWFTRKM